MSSSSFWVGFRRRHFNVVYLKAYPCVERFVGTCSMHQNPRRPTFNIIPGQEYAYSWRYWLTSYNWQIAKACTFSNNSQGEGVSCSAGNGFFSSKRLKLHCGTQPASLNFNPISASLYGGCRAWRYKPKAARSSRKYLQQARPPSHLLEGGVPASEVEKYWAQRYRLFSRFDEGIQIDRGERIYIKPSFFKAHSGFTVLSMLKVTPTYIA